MWSRLNTYVLVVASVVAVFIPFGHAQDVQRIVVQGIVFHDKNNNQRWDRGEKRIRDVMVSNGKDIVRTNRKGEYQMHVQPGKSIFPVLPPDYTIHAGDLDVVNANFLYVDPLLEHPDTIVFPIPLQAIKSPDHFRFGAIGDVQIGNEEERRYAARSIFSELKQRNDLAFQVVLGDLVNDELPLLPAFKAMLANLDHPSWTLAGNHDRDVSLPDYMDHAFNRHFGSSNYAFYYGHALFVVFNNVHSTGKHGYEGRYHDDQLTFFNHLTGALPSDQLIIINQHIPLRSTTNRDELIRLLARFDRVLVLSGHTHRVSRHFYGDGNIHEVVVGAPSGTWWRGEKDLDGIPLALQHGGSPRNYFTVDVAKEGYQIRYKAIGLDEHKQAGLSLQGDSLIINLYGGSERSKVNVRVNGGQVQLAEKTRMPDPIVSLIVKNNRAKIYPTPGNRILPLREQPSSHIWVLDLGSVGAANLRTVELLAEDDYGYRVHQHFFF